MSRKVALQVRCYEWQADAYHAVAKAHGMKLSQFVRHLLERALDERQQDCTTESALQPSRD